MKTEPQPRIRVVRRPPPSIRPPQSPLRTTYRPHQAEEIVRRLNFVPSWLIDCGPGLGGESEVFKRTWPNVRIIGLEPSRSAYFTIKSWFPGILLNEAVYSFDGSVKIANPNSPLNTFVDKSGERGTLTRPCVTLDTLYKRYAHLDRKYGRIENCFVWADIEGCEEELLAGASTVIANRQVRGFNLEVHDGEPERRIDRIMSGHGFTKVWSYATNGLHHDNVYLDLR